jgi:hypothetical protein
MVSSFTPELLRLLGQTGCCLVRPGKGDHSIWCLPITKLHFTVVRTGFVVLVGAEREPRALAQPARWS